MPATIWFSCGVLRAELTALWEAGKIQGQLFFADSMLHMDPPRLEAVMASYLEKNRAASGRIVVVYGDCCSRMHNMVRDYRVARVDAINCAQMLVGKARYRELMRQDAFIFLPEWLPRWPEIFRVELGLSAELAKGFFVEYRKEFVYLDTGLVPVPIAELQACADFAGLPWRVEKVDLQSLLDLLLDAEKQSIILEKP